MLDAPEVLMDIEAEVKKAQKEMPKWSVYSEHGAILNAASPTHEHDGILIIAESAGELVSRVRNFVRVEALAMGRGGLLLPDDILAGVRPEAWPTHVVPESQTPPRLTAVPTTYEESKQRGFEGDACIECGQMMMVRNGSCLKCMACGSTSGCS